MTSDALIWTHLIYIVVCVVGLWYIYDTKKKLRAIKGEL